MFRYIKYLYKYLASGQISVYQRGAPSIAGIPHTRKITTHRITLSTGGFIEIVWDAIPDSAYVRIHLGTLANPHVLDETYKYVRYGRDKEMVWLLRELRSSLGDLMDSLKD